MSRWPAKKLKVTAIVPAYNEERTIGKVLKVLTRSSYLDEIIVVDDGSTDQTSRVVSQTFPQVRLISKPKNEGKANAMLIGAQASKNPILFFCDADLTNLQTTHIGNLIKPVLTGKTKMVVGLQEHMNVWQDERLLQKIFGPPKKTDWSKTNKMSEFLKGLGGEKVLFKKDFLAVPQIKDSGYGVEHKIINYFKERRWPFEYQVLENVGHVWKGNKWGLKGLAKDISSFLVFGKQYLKL